VPAVKVERVKSVSRTNQTLSTIHTTCIMVVQVSVKKHNYYFLIVALSVLCLLFEFPALSTAEETTSWSQSPMHPIIPSVSYHNNNPSSTSSSSSSKRIGGHRDNIESFLSDLAELDSLSGTVDILTKSHSKSDSSYTKSWTNDDWKLHQLKSLRRYTKHLRSWWTSPTFISVLPTVAASFLWTSICILAVQCQLVKEYVQQAPFSHSISSFTSPISILLALKINRSLNRLFEARTAWGNMIRAATSLAGMAVNYIVPIDPEKGILIGRYLAAFGWCMKGKFRGGEDDSIVIRTLLPSNEVAWLESCKNGPGNTVGSPSAIIFRLRSIIANITNNNGPEGRMLSVAASQVMEQQLGELEKSVGTCKKIVASPIPPTFTRMTSRVLCLFLFFLPLALVSSGMQSPVAILVIVTFLSYIFVGIDEISVEVEHPYPLLPMFSLANNLKNGVGNQYKMMKELTTTAM
ncbi:MAG: putative membrane protein, partial [Bacillariaceae sp.]|jgi:putative membrane protein